jgi:hypothetical protein
MMDDQGLDGARAASGPADPVRRKLLQAGVAGAAALALRPALSWAVPSASGVLVNDVTRLNPVWVDRLLTPHTTDDVRQALTTWSGPVSIGGARRSDCR